MHFLPQLLAVSGSMLLPARCGQIYTKSLLLWPLFFLTGAIWPGLAVAQCADGSEVCFEETDELVNAVPIELKSEGAVQELSSDEITVIQSGTDNAPANALEIINTDPFQESTHTEEANSDTTLLDTNSNEKSLLIDGITLDLERRRLTQPEGNNAHEKILRLRAIDPQHDYSQNGEKYIARILILMGRQALRRGDLELASRRLVAALRFDPEVKRQDQLQSAIAAAARDKQTKSKTEEAARTGYLKSDKALDPSSKRIEEVKFVAPVMVAIPAGNYLMGSDAGAEDEKPVHHVVLEAFSMSKHEITLQQYRVFALASGRPAPQYAPAESNFPVTNVSWYDAVAYVEWLSDKTKRAFRLPSESEWEYAVRAGTTTTYFTGDSLVGLANCAGCDGKWSGKSAAPVGSFEPNEFGLYDMHGNVWEWVADCWTDNYNNRSKSAEAIEIKDCDRRVLRGGSWYNDSDYARSSYRGNESAVFRDGGVGFRVVHEGL